MEPTQPDLTTAMNQGAIACIRNLAAAEAAVLRGQFNVAKVLRAAALSQQVLALNAARHLVGHGDALEQIQAELVPKAEAPAPADDPAITQYQEQTETVRTSLAAIVARTRASLAENSDVLESDVAQFVRVCHGCGYVVEGGAPHTCPVCGALSVEFEGFGPFYSSTPEHLGQLTPTAIIETLAAIPDEVEAVIGTVTPETLQRQPSPAEWSAAEIVGHMLVTDRLFLLRARALLEEQGRELPMPKPPWKLHEGKGYEAMTASKLLREMRAARTQSLELIQGLEPADWGRSGLNFGAKITMLDLCTWLANHDRGHLEQIRRLCAS